MSIHSIPKVPLYTLYMHVHSYFTSTSQSYITQNRETVLENKWEVPSLCIRTNCSLNTIPRTSQGLPVIKLVPMEETHTGTCEGVFWQQSTRRLFVLCTIDGSKCFLADSKRFDACNQWIYCIMLFQWRVFPRSFTNVD